MTPTRKPCQGLARSIPTFASGVRPIAEIQSWYAGAFATPPCARRHMRASPDFGEGAMVFVQLDDVSTLIERSPRRARTRLADGAHVGLELGLVARGGQAEWIRAVESAPACDGHQLGDMSVSPLGV